MRTVIVKGKESKVYLRRESILALDVSGDVLALETPGGVFHYVTYDSYEEAKDIADKLWEDLYGS